MRARWMVSLVVAGAALSLCLAACGKQAEGQRCSVLAVDQNGNGDCAPPLVCTPLAAFGGSNSDKGIRSDICCPADRSKATTDVCSLEIPLDAGGVDLDDGGQTPTDDAGDADADSGS